MASYGKALRALGVTGYVLRGKPTDQTDFLNRLTKVTGVNADGLVEEQDDASDVPVTFSQVEAKYQELLAAEPLEKLRAERDRRLAATDWWASSDLTMTQAQTNYRQALRDITDNATSLDDVTWPTKP